MGEIKISLLRDIFMQQYLKECYTNQFVRVLYGSNVQDWNGLRVSLNGYASKLSDVGYLKEDLYSIVKDCLTVYIGNEISSPVDLYKTVRPLTDILDLVEKKNHDYGSAVFNAPCCITSLPIDSAILVRLSDKIRRYDNIIKQEALVEETKLDTVKDIVGYLFLLWCVKESEDEDNRSTRE